MTEFDPHSDDDDLELEPIDPEILEHQRQRAQEKTRLAEDAVDIDEVYREAEATDPLTWDDLQRFRFTTRHLLIATALLSVVLTFNEIWGCFGMFLVGVIALAAGWYFVLHKERQERLERERRRLEVEQRVAANRGEDVVIAPTPAETVAAADEVDSEPSFRFSFSMKEMFAAFTTAAVFFAVVRWLGGPENAAILLGMIALTGLVAHTMGLDPPPVLVLGWWLLLVLYIAASLWATFNPANVAAVEGGANFVLGSILRL